MHNILNHLHRLWSHQWHGIHLHRCGHQCRRQLSGFCSLVGSHSSGIWRRWGWWRWICRSDAYPESVDHRLTYSFRVADDYRFSYALTNGDLESHVNAYTTPGEDHYVAGRKGHF